MMPLWFAVAVGTLQDRRNPEELTPDTSILSGETDGAIERPGYHTLSALVLLCYYLPASGIWITVATENGPCPTLSAATM